MPSTGFVEFLLDQLDAVADVRAQRMFGGFGLYSGDVFFGLVSNDLVYFKVNDESRSHYIRAGMAPFKPYADRPMTMQYYQVPVAVLEDADELCRWARRAVAAANGPPSPKGRRPAG
jgi:DNA transformation protein